MLHFKHGADPANFRIFLQLFASISRVPIHHVHTVYVCRGITSWAQRGCVRFLQIAPGFPVRESASLARGERQRQNDFGCAVADEEMTAGARQPTQLARDSAQTKTDGLRLHPDSTSRPR